MNATYLFNGLHDGIHSAEDFWSSAFAIQILDASKRGIALHIPLHVYQHAEPWRFQPVEPLIIPEQVAIDDVLVGTILKTKTFPGLRTSLEQDFANLKPDIVLRLPDRVWIIETKTVGASILANERKYPQLVDWLTNHGCPARACFLLSAGHEDKGESDWNWLAKMQQKVKLILWEQFFKAVEAQVPDALLTRIIPDLRNYYAPEDEYLHGSSPGTRS